MKKIRTFVAVEMPEKVREQFREVQAQLRQADAHVKWVEPHNIHVTLKFLGEVSEEELEKVYAGVTEGVETCAPFEIDLAQLGAFPNLRRPRVVWIGIESGKEKLIELQKKVEECISQHGFPREKRSFSPHITIGRVKSPRGVDDLVNALKVTAYTSESFEVDEVVVMESTLTPEGPIYSPLRRVGLQK
jgi:2'-5' RNA ligase